MKNKVKLAEAKEYYEERYLDESRSKRRLKDYEIYLKYLGVNKDCAASLLDISSGRGLLLINAENWGLKTYGLDISLTALKVAKKNSTKTEYLLSSAEDISIKDNVFDYVSCLGSLEHFLDIPKAIAEMIRVAKQDAKYCIMVPNNVHYRLDAKSRFGIKKVQGTKQQEMQEELHSLVEWKTILYENGLKVEKVYKDRFFVRKKNPLKNILFYLWLELLPMKYSYQFIFICKSK